MCEIRGLKWSTAHGPRAERRGGVGGETDRGGEEEEEEKRERGELVTSCSSRTDNDGAVLPCSAAGKLTS